MEMMFENRKIEDLFDNGVTLAMRNILARYGIIDTYTLYEYLVEHNGSLRDIKNFGRCRTLTLKQVCPEVFRWYNISKITENDDAITNAEKAYIENDIQETAECSKKMKDPYIYEDLCMAFIRRDDLQIQLKACEQNIRYLMQKLTFM